jgi:hypothetical protein
MRSMLLMMVVIILAGCVQEPIGEQPNAIPKDTTTRDLQLTEEEVTGLGMTTNGCTFDRYDPDSPIIENNFCNYSRDDTTVYVIIKKFTNLEDLNGSYQYDSYHLFGADGLISENTYGDQSRFRVNSEDDYGAEHDSEVYYYHLWIVKDLYLVHITSSGAERDKELVAGIGERILSRLGR